MDDPLGNAVLMVFEKCSLRINELYAFSKKDGQNVNFTVMYLSFMNMFLYKLKKMRQGPI